jgi:uncharacterized protein YjbI with pentapeptide repeats
MNPTVVAAWIAAGVSVLTLVGTLAAQYFGRRGTNKDTEKAFAEQREQLDRTLAEQRGRTLNERFATAAEQLGSDKPAVRLAGVYAMAGLVDDWAENRQTCVDVLCAYLRMPYETEPGHDAPELQRLTFQAIREVRHTVIRVITAHLKKDAAVSWQGLNLDFTGVVFDGGDFSGAQFSGKVSFSGAVFSGGQVNFDGTIFSGEVSFSRSVFSVFSEISFPEAVFSGRVSFSRAVFNGGSVKFSGAEFSGGRVSFSYAVFTAGQVNFRSADFTGGEVSFRGARFTGGEVSFRGARFTGGEVSFHGVEFTGGELDFDSTEFTGSEVSFYGAEFSGGTVDFSAASDWSFPPRFPWTGTSPSGVKLPAIGGA